MLAQGCIASTASLLDSWFATAVIVCSFRCSLMLGVKSKGLERVNIGYGKYIYLLTTMIALSSVVPHFVFLLTILFNITQTIPAVTRQRVSN